MNSGIQHFSPLFSGVFPLPILPSTFFPLQFYNSTGRQQERNAQILVHLLCGSVRRFQQLTSLFLHTLFKYFNNVAFIVLGEFHKISDRKLSIISECYKFIRMTRDFSKSTRVIILIVKLFINIKRYASAIKPKSYGNGYLSDYPA